MQNDYQLAQSTTSNATRSCTLFSHSALSKSGKYTHEGSSSIRLRINSFSFANTAACATTALSSLSFFRSVFHTEIAIGAISQAMLKLKYPHPQMMPAAASFISNDVPNEPTFMYGQVGLEAFLGELLSDTPSILLGFNNRYRSDPLSSFSL